MQGGFEPVRKWYIIDVFLF